MKEPMRKSKGKIRNTLTPVEEQAPKLRNSPLFTCLSVTVLENSEENEMSDEFLFSSCKMMGRKQGAPQDPEGVERGVPLLKTPSFYNAKIEIHANFRFFQLFIITWLVKR